MNETLRPEDAWPVALGGLLVLAGSLAVWSWIARRLSLRQPILRSEPRRPVPWEGVDLLAVVLFFITAAYMLAWVDISLFAVRPEPVAQQSKAQPDVNHQLVVLLRQDPGLASLAWCLAAAVLVAPIAEEMFFSALLAGMAGGGRAASAPPSADAPRRGAGSGPGDPCLSAAFAAPHFRQAAPPANPEWLLHGLIRTVATNLLTLAFAVGLVRWKGATWADLGLSAPEFWSDARLGFLAFLAVVLPIYFLQMLLTAVLPAGLAPDPITLFFFAMVLGVLYHRTHRIVPSIVLHMSLNATSLAVLAYALTRSRA